MTTLDEYQAIAEAATPGPWETAVISLEQEQAIATFIATFDPPTVLKMLAVIKASMGVYVLKKAEDLERDQTWEPAWLKAWAAALAPFMEA